MGFPLSLTDQEESNLGAMVEDSYKNVPSTENTTISLECSEKMSTDEGEESTSVATTHNGKEGEQSTTPPAPGGGHNEEEAPSVGAEEEEDDRDRGVIRIRDFSSLREQDESSDDEIVEIPPVVKVHTPYVQMGKGSDVALDMDCVVDNVKSKATEAQKDKRRKGLFLRRKLVELGTMLQELNKRGHSGIDVRDHRSESERHPQQTSNVGLSQGPTPTPQYSMASGNIIRITSSSSSNVSTPVSCIVTSRGGLQQIQQGQQVGLANNQFPRGYTTAIAQNRQPSIRPHILSSGNPVGQHQNRLPTPAVVFDHKTGLLVYPNNQPGTLQNTTTAVRPNTVRTIPVQASPQLVAAIRSGALQLSRPLVMNGVSKGNQAHRFDCSQVTDPNMRQFFQNYLQQSPGALQGTQQQNVGDVAARQATQQYFRENPGAVGTITRSSTGAITVNPPRLKVIAPKAGSQNANDSQSVATSIANGNTINTVLKPITNPPPVRQKQIFPPAATAAPVSASFNRNTKTFDNSTTKTIGKETRVTAGTQQSETVLDPRDKSQNAKTFPSLVVIVKPYLQEKLTKSQIATVRSELDSKVKQILMQTPAKFTEWLIQKGLLKMDLRCSAHRSLYKLGMYSDTDKYPYSGGYIFTSDCCPDKKLVVFQGSIFEASIYPPGTTMKLIYHWACQTPAPQVLQWVKVTSYYLKNFYTLLRSVCVAALHENASSMGGKGKYIEVGVVTLGTLPAATTSQTKQTQIEIFGVFDPGSKFIRMKLLNSTPNLSGEMAKRERNQQILTPLSKWVSRESVLLIDSTLDKATVERLGFKNVSQTKTHVGVKTTIPTNVNVMNYLKNIVPRMFQNTLCVLSRSLIQQFLDELSWRELYGPHPLKTFENILVHLSHMTKADVGELLIPRLNNISLDPFSNWNYSQKKAPAAPMAPVAPVAPVLPPSGIECLPDSIRSQPLSELIASAVGLDPSISSLVSTYLNGHSSTTTTLTKTTANNYNLPKVYSRGTKRKQEITPNSVNRSPPPKKPRSKTNKSNLQTLNSSLAVPLNPGAKYQFTPMKLKISDIESFTGMDCWECSKPIRLPHHYRGTMKCSRCRFETCCSFTIQKHIATHDAVNLNQTAVRTKLALARETDMLSDAMECTGCYFVSASTRRFATHLLTTGHKACIPKNNEKK